MTSCREGEEISLFVTLVHKAKGIGALQKERGFQKSPNLYDIIYEWPFRGQTWRTMNQNFKRNLIIEDYEIGKQSKIEKKYYERKISVQNKKIICKEKAWTTCMKNSI